MSVSSSTAKVSYTLTTGSQALTVPFRFLSNSHVKAVKAGDSPVTLVENTDYTLTGAGVTSGTLTTIATVGNGLAAGSVVVIKRNVPLTQETSYSYNGDFSSSVQETVEDKLTMIAQQLNEKADRALHFPEDDTTNTELASKFDRAGMIQGYDLNGAPALYSADVSNNTYRYQTSNVSSLRSGNYSSFSNNEQVFLGGYYNAGDGGGGMLYVDKADTTTADNGVTVFVASDGTRLKRPSSGEINALQAGMVGDCTNGTNGTDNTARFQAAINAGGQNPVIYFPKSSGRYRYSSVSFTNLDGKLTLKGDGYQNTNAGFFGNAAWLAGSTTGSVLQSTAASGNSIAVSAINSVDLECIAIIGPGSGTATGVYSTSASTYTLNQHWFKAMVANFATGCTFTMAFEAMFNSCQFYGCTIGTRLESPSNNNTFINCQWQATTTHGVHIINSATNNFNGCLWQAHTGNGIYADTGSTGINVYGCWFESQNYNTYAINLNGSSKLKCYGSRFSSLLGNHECDVILMTNSGYADFRMNTHMYDSRLKYASGSYGVTSDTHTPFDSSVDRAVRIIEGEGNPEGSVSAPIGSIFLRADGGAMSTIYTKESGVGNTGWSRVITNGAVLGFYGVNPVFRQVLATGTGKTVDNVITALQNLGLVSQS